MICHKKLMKISLLLFINVPFIHRTSVALVLNKFYHHKFHYFSIVGWPFIFNGKFKAERRKRKKLNQI